jgi:hypothetical protein
MLKRLSPRCVYSVGTFIRCTACENAEVYGDLLENLYGKFLI